MTGLTSEQLTSKNFPSLDIEIDLILSSSSRLLTISLLSKSIILILLLEIWMHTRLFCLLLATSMYQKSFHVCKVAPSIVQSFMHLSASAVRTFVSLSTQRAQLILPELPLKSFRHSPVYTLKIFALSEAVSSRSDALFHIIELMSASLLAWHFLIQEISLTSSRSSVCFRSQMLITLSFPAEASLVPSGDMETYHTSSL
mmetsp:Transcript_39914/g.45800  ORF Transcript_39914/g.45800 Transcript_39914/m.45800 type:complete len:200 (+) Transcript_39914:485-1084(+)